MRNGRARRRGAWGLALLVALGVLAAGGGRWLGDDVGADRGGTVITSTAQEAAQDAAAVARDAESLRWPNGRPTRMRRARAEAEREAALEAVEAAEADAARGKTVELDELGGLDDTSPAPEDEFRARVARVLRFFSDSELAPERIEARLDSDPVGGATPEAPAGRPPEMRLEHFARHGPRTVEAAVELIGERDPELEEGVPVSLTGRVVAQDTGDPIAGATVVVNSTFYVRALQYDHHLREVARAVTDAAGAFHVKRLNADPVHFGTGGRVYVTVTAPGRAPALAIPLDRVAPGFRNRLPDIELDGATHTLRGRVRCMWDGEPVVGARVIATGAIDPVAYPKDQREALFVGAPETVTGADGRFALPGLGAGVQNVSFHGGDDCIGSELVRVRETDEVVFSTRQIRGRIEGRVVDADGLPVPLAVVEGGWNTTHAFADGRFVLENFRGDVIDLRVSHAAFRPHVERGVPDGRTGLEITLARRLPRLRLAVRRHDDGTPVRSITVTLTSGTEPAGNVPASNAFLSEEGVHFLVVPAGTSGATIAAAGLVPRTIDLAAVQDGDHLDVVLETAVPTAAPGLGGSR